MRWAIVTDRYAYDAFGAARTQTGTTTEWSFTGEQNDPTGLEYLRARYYGASTGRFLSQDPLPLLQRYAYANDNPANLVDPTGQFSVKDAASDVYEIAKQILADPCWKTHIFCPHPALHWMSGVVQKAADYTSSKMRECFDSQTCMSYIGGGVFIAGAITGQPWLMGAGLGIMTYNDGRGCANGSGLSCTFLAFDLVSAGAATYGSYGVRWAAAAPPLDLPPTNYAIQAISYEIFNGSYSLGISTTAGTTAATLSTTSAAADQLLDRYWRRSP